MAQTVGDVMTRNPASVERGQPVVEAARLMREADAGAVVVLDNGKVSGIVTDRDITVRIVADGRDVSSATVADAATTIDLTTVGPDTSVDQAAQLMRQNAIRRLPIVENDRAVGILSIGDLAMERDTDSALADISAAPSNN